MEWVPDQWSINLHARSTSNNCLLFDEEVQSWVTKNCSSLICTHRDDHGSY